MAIYSLLKLWYVLVEVVGIKIIQMALYRQPCASPDALAQELSIP